MSKVTIAGDVNGTGVFTIAAPNGNTNRTLTLPDEAGTVLTSASSITSSQLTGDAVPIGVGQSYSDVTASRALNTTYTNSTGKPIFIIVTVNGYNGTSASTIKFTVNGTDYAEEKSNEYYSPSNLTPSIVSIGGIVPAGATYKITTGGQVSALLIWSELS